MDTKTIEQRRKAAKEDGMPDSFYRLESSQIRAIAWFGAAGEDFIKSLTPETDSTKPSLGALNVVFTKGDRWVYKGVPRHKVQGLLNAPSAGKYFNSEIKSHPAYFAHKLEPVTIIPKAPAPQAEP